MKTLFVLIAALNLALSSIVVADVGPTTRFHSLVQQGQNVEITIAVPDDGGYLSVSDQHTLTGKQNGTTETLFEHKVFAESTDEVENSIHVCSVNYSYGTPVDCELNPEECFDCDGDETPECDPNSYCDYYALFDYVDECVPQGSVVYKIQNEEHYYSEDEKTINVVDVDECNGGSDVDSDSDLDTETGNDTDSGSDAGSDIASDSDGTCECVTVGGFSSVPTFIFFLSLLNPDITPR